MVACTIAVCYGSQRRIDISAQRCRYTEAVAPVATIISYRHPDDLTPGRDAARFYVRSPVTLPLDAIAKSERAVSGLLNMRA